jgi:hypothetical protein
MTRQELYKFIVQITPDRAIGVLRTDQPLHHVEHYDFFSDVASPGLEGQLIRDSFFVTATTASNSDELIAISIQANTAEGIMFFSTTDPRAVERLAMRAMHP